MGWLSALGLALSIVTWDGIRSVRYYTRISGTYGVAVRAPVPDSASRTGYVDGRRTVAYPASSVDGLHWIMQTQQMLATGSWRIRHVNEDNAPDGRDVHWGSPFRWWLGLCAWLDHLVTGRSPGAAVEYAGLWANPALLAALLLVVVPWVARAFGAGAAAWVALAMVGTPAFTLLFAGDNPDHHGMIQCWAMVCVLSLVAGGSGWVRSPAASPVEGTGWIRTEAQARLHFRVSALAGAMAMWVSAVSAIPMLCAIGLGAVWCAWLARRDFGGAHYQPALWRTWGFLGGAACLLAWLVEYAPLDFGWRLEVNHPLYALAWAGAGEILAQATARVSGCKCRAAGTARLRLLAGVVAVLLPLVAVLLRGDRVFVVRDRYLWSLNHDYVPEFRGLLHALRVSGLNFSTVAFCLPMGALLLVGGWMWRRATTPGDRALAAMPFAAAAFFSVLSFKELRWWTVAFGFLFVVVPAALRGTARANPRLRRVMWASVVAVMVPGLIDSMADRLGHGPITADDFLTLSERDLAQTLRQRAGDGPLVVLSSPATTSRLIYFGGARGLGTPYWENLDGMKRAGAIFAASTDGEARELARAAGVTHIVVLSWDDFIEPYVRLARGLAPNEPISGPAFGLELARGAEPPPWLKRLPDHLPAHPALRGKLVRIFEVTDRTRPEQVVVRAVNDALYRGDLAAAARRAPELLGFSQDLGAQLALARVRRAGGDVPGFTEAFGRLGALAREFPLLEPEDQVSYAELMAGAGLRTEARARLGEILDRFKESEIRHLPPASLLALLSSTAALDVPWPSASLRDLAISLVPPDGRP